MNYTYSGIAYDEESAEIIRFHNQLNSLEKRLKEGHNLVQLHDLANFLLQKSGSLFNNIKDNNPDAINKRDEIDYLIGKTKSLIKEIEYQNFCFKRGQPVSIYIGDDDQYNSMARVHSSISDVKEIFENLSHIVREQDPLIDSIESQIEETNDRTQKGREELSGATSSVSSRRWLIAKVTAASVAIILVCCLIF